MSSKTGAIELNEGEGHSFLNTNLTTHQGSSALVVNGGVGHSFVNTTISMKSEKEVLLEVNNIIKNIADNSIFSNTQSTYKNESLILIEEILKSLDKPSRLQKIANLTAILCGWLTVKIELTSVLSPYILQLHQMVG